METLAKRVKKRRQELNLTQPQLAEKVFISQAMISKIEKDFMTPSANTLIRLADALDCSTDYLLGRT